MKNIYYLVTSFFLIFIGCSTTPTLNEQFNKLESTDFSFYNNMSIIAIPRMGIVTYAINFKGMNYFVRRNIFTKKISSIEDGKTGTGMQLPKEDKKYLQAAIDKFDNLWIQNLSVDAHNNIELSFQLKDYCTYNFLRLSPNNTLEDIKKQFYQQYKDNWYLDKKCAER